LTGLVQRLKFPDYLTTYGKVFFFIPYSGFSLRLKGQTISFPKYKIISLQVNYLLFYRYIFAVTGQIIKKKKGKIVGSYLSFINLNLIVEFGRTAFEEIFNIL